MDRCSKCNTEADFFVNYKTYGEDMSPLHRLCPLCNRAFDIRGHLLNEFLKDDFGEFPVSQVTKNMINARRARSVGEGPWAQKFEANEQ